MDARHESLLQGISNEFIHFMNKFIQENLDDIILDNDLCDDMRKILELIYFYTDMHVDVENILSKKNFLSIDTVFLPYIQESANKFRKNPGEFSHFLQQIELIVTQSSESEHAEFYKSIATILARYQ